MEGSQNSQAKEESNRFYRVLLVIGIIFVAFNLRPAITSVGPVIGIIRDDLGLSNWSAGLLTSLPLIAFAIISPLAPRLGNKYSNERVLLIGLILLLFGVITRSLSLVVLLFLGTMFIGLGIAVCNVLLPGVIKEKFPAKVALMTSVYSTAMGIFAAAASGLSIPLARGTGWGWQLSLLFWTIPAVIGIVIWVYLSKRDKAKESVAIKFVQPSNNRMWRSPLAWQVACYMGLQSFLFYVTISWLPAILQGYGVSVATAGWMLSFTQFVGLPASFFVPVIANRFRSQSIMVVVLNLFVIGGYVGLLLGDSYTVMIISTISLGIGLSGNFSLALSFLGMRARTAKQAGELSGMAQSLGYTLAAVGPMFIGFLFDITHAWSVPLLTLIGVAVLIAIFGSGAGRNRYVLD